MWLRVRNLFRRLQGKPAICYATVHPDGMVEFPTTVSNVTEQGLSLTPCYTHVRILGDPSRVLTREEFDKLYGPLC